MTSESLPSPFSASNEHGSPALATDRFQEVRKLGAGGMATVYEVLDKSTGRRLALKRLHVESDPKRRRRILELFEREFYALSQISHPCVVTAYDYGVDSDGAYYTMELLEGGELQGLAPLPWADVCRIGRDVCSALSLLHSRRLVYRDLNPRNVHCTPQRSAKLIDFGGVTNMGPSRQVVGTPAYCAPEALDLQPLDARTDLFSLGATLYFALTARHAYPARTFEQLRAFWNGRPARPSELVQGIPPALDALVMDLLHLDPAVRPANAAEVVEQLAAIDRRPIEEAQLDVTQSYLSTPNLVGRDPVLARVRAKLLRTLRGTGSALLLTGSSGVGRSRLLSACLLEAKLLGALAVSADASDAESDYGVARALGLGLFELAPELALRAAMARSGWLVHVFPELQVQLPELTPLAHEDPNRERAQLLAALREWFVAIAIERPLMLAVDDMHGIDEPSAALLALCAHEASKHALSIAATCETGATATAPSALRMFENEAASMQVQNLTASHTEDLLRSVFGDVPQIQAVARKLHGIAHGNPRDTLQLAQYLVDKKVARYQSGGWSLPASFDDGDLPANMSQALRAQIDALGERAYELAGVMALAADRGFSFDECLSLYLGVPAKQIHDSLDELLSAQVVRRVGDLYTTAHRGFQSALTQALDVAERQRLHRLIALLFARRGSEEFRRAMHLLEGGDSAAGLDVLVAYALASQSVTDKNPLEYLKLVRSMPDNWLEVYGHAIALCDSLERPISHAFALRNRLAGLVTVMNAPSDLIYPHLHALLRQLKLESGLTDHENLDPALDPSTRLTRALGIAAARYQSSPDHARCLEPTLAIRHLVRSQIAAAGMAASALDFRLWSALPSLTPLAPLSPSIGIMDRLVEGVGARIVGRHELACAAYRKIIERTEQPDRAGLDESNHRFLRYGVMYGLGVMEAGMGLASALDWSDAIASEPLHQVNAVQIQILHRLWQGRVREADQLRERVELLRLEASPRQLADGAHLVWQVTAHAHSDDLTRLKHALDEVRLVTDRFPGWLAVLHYASGEYQRIRGDQAAAAAQLEAALTACSAGNHQIWPHAAGAYTDVLSSLGRLDDAVAFGSDALAAGERAGVGYLMNYLRMPLALALAQHGDHARARELADEVVANFEGLASEGLNLVLAYEARARVAILGKDTSAYESFARRCAEHCRAAGSRVLIGRYERMVRSAVAAAVHVPDAPADLGLSTLMGSQLTSVLVGCDKPSERAARALQLLLSTSGVESGCLFLIGDHGPELVAQIGPNPPAALTSVVSEYIAQELQERELNTCSIVAGPSLEPPALMDESAAEQRHQLVLLSHQTPHGFAITGVAALLVLRGVPFVHPGALAAHLSRLTFDAGDVTPILAD